MERYIATIAKYSKQAIASSCDVSVNKIPSKVTVTFMDKKDKCFNIFNLYITQLAVSDLERFKVRNWSTN